MLDGAFLLRNEDWAEAEPAGDVGHPEEELDVFMTSANGKRTVTSRVCWHVL